MAVEEKVFIFHVKIHDYCSDPLAGARLRGVGCGELFCLSLFLRFKLHGSQSILMLRNRLTLVWISNPSDWKGKVKRGKYL